MRYIHKPYTQSIKSMVYTIQTRLLLLLLLNHYNHKLSSLSSIVFKQTMMICKHRLKTLIYLSALGNAIGKYYIISPTFFYLLIFKKLLLLCTRILIFYKFDCHILN